MNTIGALIPYYRKSSGEDPTESLRRQRAAVTSWAEAHGVNLAPAVEEPGVSGSKHWRERRLGEVIEAIRRGEAAGLIVEDQSRLTRGKQLDVAELWDELERLDARLVCTAEGIDTATGDHELNFGLRALLARDQWKQYKRRSDAVKASRIEAGVFIGPAPTGYAKGRTRGLVPDPAMAAVVRELFELRAAGSSWGDLLKHIDARTGQKWTQAGVAGIIRNRVYLGDLVYGELVNEGAHEALIDAPLWQAAQRHGKAPARSGRKTDKWLLSGLVVCGHCEHLMIVWRGATTRNGRPQSLQRRYRCTNRACAVRPSVQAPLLEEWFPESLWMLLGSGVVEPAEETDLGPLEEAEATARRRLDQVMAPEARDALGDLWAADVKARRLELEAAQAELGEARAAAGDDRAALIVDLRERWDELDSGERRERLRVYGDVRVIVDGPKPADWQLWLP